MISEIGYLIGNTIGKCISVEADEKGCCVGIYMRIRIKYEIKKPLRRVLKLTLDPSNPPEEILIRYERLPEYCYMCGIIGHQIKECTIYEEEFDSKEQKYI